MSDPPPVSEAVKELIRARLHSIEELEVLLMLAAEPGRSCSAAEVAAQLRISSALVEAALEGLGARGLVRGDATFQYSPENVAVASAVADLARLYEVSRVETLVLISQSALERVRNHALHTFAEAFRMGGRKNNG